MRHRSKPRCSIGRVGCGVGGHRAGKASVGREGCSVGEGLEAASAGYVRAGLEAAASAVAAAAGVEGESVNDLRLGQGSLVISDTQKRKRDERRKTNQKNYQI